MWFLFVLRVNVRDIGICDSHEPIHRVGDAQALRDYAREMS
jgi:hypothetical protein